ncbi:hypothetical protein [Peribacillus butanolivorans]|uniref:hypothetical protein n=1 Tax=Peribacillus butanolivorans TaxID=421767 RepID=UPI00207C691B|nr:hypothetical protein [Peribacillus butanolivorans]
MMKSEYTHIEGWKEWYGGQNIPKEEEELFKKINAIRIRTEKTSTLHTGTSVIFDVTKESVTDEVKKKLKAFDKKKKVNITFSMSDEPDINNEDENGFRIKGKINEYFQTLKDFPEEDVIKICETYINSLEKWVLECERLFGNKLEMELIEGLTIKFSDPDIFK